MHNAREYTWKQYVTDIMKSIIMRQYMLGPIGTWANQYPHGNDKNSIRNYVRTQPHVLRDTKTAGQVSAKSVYHSLVAAAGPVQASSSTSAPPRNSQQIRNVQSRTRHATRLTHDAIYNLTEFAHDGNFVHRIVVFPDLEVTITVPPRSFSPAIYLSLIHI